MEPPRELAALKARIASGLTPSAALVTEARRREAALRVADPLAVEPPAENKAAAYVASMAAKGMVLTEFTRLDGTTGETWALSPEARRKWLEGVTPYPV